VTYEEAKAQQDSLFVEMSRLGAVLDTFPKGAMGLTTDAARATPEFRRAKADFNRAFQRVRAFNVWFVETFKRERAAERRAR
jgi:hypothetical protein